MLLMIDNYDSFTYNIVQYLEELGADVLVKRNDEITIDNIKTLAPKHIVISPGPCTPHEAGVTMDVVKEFRGKTPLLGVCLGHQAIGMIYGANLIRADQIMHGKTSLIHHDGKGVFTGLKNPYTATRYHSLILEKDSIPDSLEISAWTADDVVMGVADHANRVYGVQFHPESILSEHGHDLLKNFLEV
jgi:anthranilate synthase component 2